jgi:hypothetical protein
VWSNEFPASLDGTVLRTVDFIAQKPVTLTATPALSVASPRVGEDVSVSVPIKNFSASAIKDGQIGVAVYDQLGRNVGYAMQDLSLSAGQTLNYMVPARQFTTPGTYNAYVVQYKNGQWSDYMNLENGASNKFSFTVKPNLTLQTTPSVSPASPRVGDAVSASFTIRNYAPNNVSDGQVGLAVYDPNGKNVGYAMQDLTISADGTFTYSAPARSFTTPGTYTAWVVHYKNGQWLEYKNFENNVLGRINFTVN